MDEPLISHNVLLLICGLGVAQGIFLAGLIYFHPKSDKKVNTFLSLHIFFLSMVGMLPIMLRFINWKDSYFIQPLPMFTGPCLYFYLRSFKERITWAKIWPHLVPIVVFFILVYINLTTLASKYPDSRVIAPGAIRTPSTVALIYARVIQMIVYYFLSRRVLLSYQRSIQHLFSNTSRIDLNWARILINGYLFLAVAALIIFPLMFRFPEHIEMLMLINIALATPYIYIAAFKGISQPTIWQIRPGAVKEMHEAVEIEQQKTTPAANKQTKPLLDNDKLISIESRITGLFEKEKLYQEPELTIQQMADKLELLPYQVSHVINHGMKKNFYELVNAYRVEEAKRLLSDPRNRDFTILSVGFEAGFNSKTTFNTVFKKFTGLTPTEYRDKQRTKSPALEANSE